MQNANYHKNAKNWGKMVKSVLLSTTFVYFMKLVENCRYKL